MTVGYGTWERLLLGEMRRLEITGAVAYSAMSMPTVELAQARPSGCAGGTCCIP